jgi:uncharacterized protein (DUF362 family)
MKKTVVSLTRYKKSPDSLMEIISLCSGLEDLKVDDHVFIKPNLVGYGDIFPMPLFGIFTTTRLLEDIIIALKDHGVKSITVGEGSVYIKGYRHTYTTHQIFSMLGYPALAKYYGVELIDMHGKPFNEVVFGDLTMHISRPAMEADFFINMPVLKTHNQSILSLGLKNLKGCISTNSRRLSHSPDNKLDHYLSLFVEQIRPSLTVLDGIYGLEKDPYAGSNAIRMNAIAASRDPLSLDIAGAHLAGYNPADIPHIKESALRNNRSLSLGDIEIKGLKIEELACNLRWDNPWREDNSGPKAWDKIGLKGVRLYKYDKTLCTGCSFLYSPILLMIMSSFKGSPFDNIEILTGKSMSPSGNAAKTMLFGNCMIKKNRKNTKINEAVFVKGCPPTFEDTVEALIKCGIPVDLVSYEKLRDSTVNKYEGRAEFRDDFFYFQKKH